ncbi:MAG: DinB family protein [Phycisphaerales bacterium]
MTLELPAIINRLARSPAALRAAASIFSTGESRWKPTPKDWSVLEIVCHLADEEEEDFAPRLRATLASAPWTPLDLDNVAERRGYNTRDLAAQLERFEQARSANVAWLRSLAAGNPTPDFTIAHQHPKFGPISAGDLLTAWAAHDALHLRQIAKRLHQLACRAAEAAGHSTGYAGAW